MEKRREIRSTFEYRLNYCMDEWNNWISERKDKRVERIIGAWIRTGFDERIISYAIQETSVAPNPTVYYFMAIMRRLQRDGIYTREDLDKTVTEADRKAMNIKAVDFRRTWGTMQDQYPDEYFGQEDNSNDKG